MSTYYKRLTEIPVPSSAYFSGSEAIQVTSGFHDHTRNIKRSVDTTFIVTDASVTALPQQHDTTVVGHVLSPSRTRSAVLREIKEDSKQKRYVEIWKHNTLEAMMDVTDAHDAFYADEHFASLSFSSTETSVLYVAEANPPKDGEDSYHKFRFKPHFGEGIVGKKDPTIFLFSWSNLSDNEPVCKLTWLSISAPALFAQPVFSPDGKTIYATGYEYTLDHRLLGIIYCYNRPSGIWEITLPSFTEDTSKEKTASVICSARKLTPSNISCRSPRILSDNGKHTLLWLSGMTGGPHAATSLLYSLDITSASDARKVESPLVDLVFNPAQSAFPGLYPEYNLPLSPFLRPSGSAAPCIITHSIWGSRSTVLLISTADGKVKNLTPDDGHLYSWKVLNTDGGTRVVCTRSAPTSPPELLLGEVDSSGEVHWRVIQKPVLPADVRQALSSLNTSVIPIPGRSPTETIVIKSSKEANSGEIPPCITNPHGGPHGTTITAFSPATLAFALEGYTISSPNYTGSLGFGETAVRALPGNCGTLDVEDCIASVRQLVKLGLATEGPGKQFIYGGSHGGFLAAHLIGQYPDVFTAAIMRNPVISAGEMSSTDIPDWSYVEFGLPYPLFSSPSHTESPPSARVPPPIMSPGAFAKVHQASPIAHVQNVRAAVLLMVGADDLRVAPRQGIEYYHSLKGRRNAALAAGTGATQGEVELLIFDGESHPLQGVEASRVGWEAARDFMARARKAPA